MAQFIHLAAEANRRSIERIGIKVTRDRPLIGVYAFPQIESYQATHQWMRELRRFRGTRIIAIRFRIPDAAHVSLGKFNAEHLMVTASEAVGIAREHKDPMGLEVVIPRAVRVKEIEAFYVPPKVVGWRYYPGAKGRKPCGCPYCQRGEPFSKNIRDAYDDASA